MTGILNPAINQRSDSWFCSIETLSIVKRKGTFSLQIILAGFNLDFETIKEVKAALPGADHLTPETVSAAYARISRNPLPVNELRDIARHEVEKSRKSNQSIVFDMGHSSIAEHAVFNIDVIGVSRFIVEEIEKFRLCSYTEKSQRYIRLEDDFVVPEEVRKAALETPFVEMIHKQNRFYQELYESLRANIFDTHQELAEEPKNRSMLEGWAKEDARYVISLATESQLGMTLNARNLELMLRRCAAHSLTEVRGYGRKLYDVTKSIAPSLVRYTEATEFDRKTKDNLSVQSRVMREKYGPKESSSRAPMERDHNVTLLHVTPEADSKIVASLTYSSSDMPMEECMRIVSLMDNEEKRDVIKTALRHMKPYDPPLREFEHVGLHYEMVVSASCFAQLKRHRMATLVSQGYDPALGVTMPPSVSEVGMQDRFIEVMKQTEDTYTHIKRIAPLAAPYILTNAHRKRVTIKVNARELYHISRLREDSFAQWDIRQTAERMVRLGKRHMPLTLMLATGKDSFNSLYENVF